MTTTPATEDPVQVVLDPATGVSVEAWAKLGAERNGQAWRIPERDAEGRVIGWVRRFDDDRKPKAELGSKRGLSMAWPLPSDAGKTPADPILIVEGASDAAAGIDLGYHIIGRPSATGGRAYLRQLLRDRHVVIVGENDSGAGRSGAEKIATDLHEVVASVKLIFPPECAKDLREWYIAPAGCSREELNRLVAQASEWEPAGPTAIDPPDSFHLTEHGNSERLVARHGRDLLYCDPWARWLVWDGKGWKPDEGRRIEALAMQTIKSIYAEAADEPNTARRKALAAWAQRCETGHHVRQIIALSRHRVTVLPGQLDVDPWLFNVRNGTLDLRTGELRKHDRANRITKQAPCEYNADAECPRWLQFLNVVLAGNEGLIGFLQRMAGYALTGDTSERCLFILYGGGFNGKTVFLETLRGVFGDYALRTPAETLLAKRGDSIPNDVARLKGARLVTASETEDNRRFAEAFVKDLTGGDMITARFMRAEYFEFRPECKIVLATNHRPVVRGTDDAIWSRLRLVPFTVTIPEQDRDPQLRDKLIAESAGILAWAVRGCLEWQRSGLGSPDEVTAATEVYRSDMDVLGVFIDDCCELQSEAVTPASDLYQAYKQWADRAGERPLTQRAFGLRLKERGLDNSERMPGTRRKAWSGISLTNEFSVEREP
ncbi:MAG: hypothetical protein IID39_03725 [Planctomycetes bacterium]|nr:hypothetical protein [Planctomycetota bacterium]